MSGKNVWRREKQDIKNGNKKRNEDKIKEKMTDVNRREGIQMEREKENNQHKSKGEKRGVKMRSKKHMREE